MSEKGVLVNYALFLPSVRKNNGRKETILQEKELIFFQMFKVKPIFTEDLNWH